MTEAEELFEAMSRAIKAKCPDEWADLFDRVHVVRCKDCKNAAINENDGSIYCHSLDMWTGESLYWFCTDGEVKE